MASSSVSSLLSEQQPPGSPRQRAAKLDAIAKMAALSSPPPPPPSPDDRKRDVGHSRDLDSRLSLLEASMSRMLDAMARRAPDSQKGDSSLADAGLRAFQQQLAALPATGSLFASSTAGEPPSRDSSAVGFLSSAVLASSTSRSGSGDMSGGRQRDPQSPQAPPLSLATVLQELRDKAKEFGSLLAWVKSPDVVWRVQRNKHEVEALAEAFDALLRGDSQQAIDALARRIAKVGLADKYGRWGGVAILDPASKSEMFTQGLANDLLGVMMKSFKLEQQVDRANAKPETSYPRGRGRGLQVFARGRGRGVRLAPYSPPSTTSNSNLGLVSGRGRASSVGSSDKLPGPDTKQ